ncbi:excalibur calcium-binding domain-containing protein [Nocardia sp. NBC_00508]|uniref:excalibur calcium-binding domain-containing protein n=1 Tax=Nocardia sp. NBC_00508 TaxID=2975992 RepID=UPI002E817DE8|nr:excalibur calcium-binding domain-containing protein [Nocardia sp. NBC_00508]WUD69137.1 excalibur calcium-binding domain-containing protein [Nocardia sp. NBC_00508]
MSKSVLHVAPAIGAALLAAGVCVLVPPTASAAPRSAAAIAGSHDDHPIPHNRSGPKEDHSPPEESEQRSPKIYTNCDRVRAEGVGPLYRGQPGFNAHLDPDGDGIACN